MTSATTSSTSVSPPIPSSRTQEEARTAILASLESAGSTYDHKFTRRATDLHSNAKAIAKQEAELKQQSAALAEETAKWQKELDRATKGIKEIGDVQNWAELMERDLMVLEETLRLAEGGEMVESASGGSSWRV